MKQHYTIIFAMILLLGSCSKSKEWKLPATVQFSISIAEDRAVKEQVSFEGGYVVLGSFAVEGNRHQGEPVNFSREYESGLVVPFDIYNRSSELIFDIPQGTFDYLKIDFKTYDDPQEYSLVLEGTYYRRSGDIPVRLEVVSPETFEAEAIDQLVSGLPITLVHEEYSEAHIHLDPAYWFETISPQMMSSASETIVEGNPIILINQRHNPELYYKIVDRIDESIEAIVNVNK